MQHWHGERGFSSRPLHDATPRWAGTSFASPCVLPVLIDHGNFACQVVGAIALLAMARMLRHRRNAACNIQLTEQNEDDTM